MERKCIYVNLKIAMTLQLGLGVRGILLIGAHDENIENLKVSREDFKSFAKCLKSTHSKARIQVCRFVEYI